MATITWAGPRTIDQPVIGQTGDVGAIVSCQLNGIVNGSQILCLPSRDYYSWCIEFEFRPLSTVQENFHEFGFCKHTLSKKHLMKYHSDIL